MVCFMEARSIPKTSSGKVARQPAKQRFLENKFTFVCILVILQFSNTPLIHTDKKQFQVIAIEKYVELEEVVVEEPIVNANGKDDIHFNINFTYYL